MKILISLMLVSSSFAFAQGRHQPCQEAAEAVALGKMFEKYGAQEVNRMWGPTANFNVAPNGREYFIVTFCTGTHDGCVDYKNVMVTTYDPAIKPGLHRCVVSDVFGPYGEDVR